MAKFENGQVGSLKSSIVKCKIRAVSQSSFKGVKASISNPIGLKKVVGSYSRVQRISETKNEKFRQSKNLMIIKDKLSQEVKCLQQIDGGQSCIEKLEKKKHKIQSRNLQNSQLRLLSQNSTFSKGSKALCKKQMFKSQKIVQYY